MRIRISESKSEKLGSRLVGFGDVFLLRALVLGTVLGPARGRKSAASI